MEFNQLVDAIADRGRTRFAQQAMVDGRVDGAKIGVEVEYPHTGDRLQSIPADRYMPTLERLAARSDTTGLRDDGSGTRYTGVSFTEQYDDRLDEDTHPDYRWVEDGTHPGVDYDFGPEAEIGTDIGLALEEVYRQVRSLEQITVRNVSEGGLHRNGFLPGLIDTRSEDVISWDLDEDSDALDYVTDKHRYRSILEPVYTLHNLKLGGTGSIQVTMTPKPVGTVDGVAPDETFKRFFGGGEYPGIPALSGLFLPLTANSPVIHDGELVTRYGREWAYEDGRMNSPVLSPEDGAAKFGYYPDWDDVTSIEDIVKINAERPVEALPFSADDVSLPGGRGAVHEEDEFPSLDGDDTVHVMGAETPGDTVYDTIDFTQFVEDQYLSGVAPLQTAEGDQVDVPVVIDYTDHDAEDFLPIAFNAYDTLEGTNVPNYRFKTGVGAVESRDHCNNPYLEETVAIQAGIFRQWQELQELAADYGITNADAFRLRNMASEEGVPDLHAAYLQDALPIILDGVQDVSRGPEPAIAVANHVDSVLRSGLTPADEFYQEARKHGVAAAYRQDRVKPLLYRVR